jgi:dsDNA-specific endonuclease/ATPase MutS2
LSSEKDLNEEYRAVIESLDQFYREVNLQISDLDKALQQIDKYQQDIQTLKQKLVQEEQLLKSMTPEHPADNVQVRVCFLFPSTLFQFLSLSHHQKTTKYINSR